MPIGRSLFWGLGLTAVLAVPARAECFNNCGFGTMIALVVGVGLAVVALVVFLLWKLRLGWTIKWLAAAVALAVAVPPAFLGYIHDRKHRAVESLDFAGPLPRLDERRPLILVYDLSFLNCPAALERYVAAKSWQEVLLVEMWSLEGIDFSRPVALADLPMLRQTMRDETSAEGSTADGRMGTPVTDRSLLSPEERKVMAAEVDYLVIADCYGRSALAEALRLNPALQGLEEQFRVELALAPLQKGEAAVFLPELTFDLLDLGFDGATPGFLFAGTRVGGANEAPFDPAVLQESFCRRVDGTALDGCGF